MKKTLVAIFLLLTLFLTVSKAQWTPGYNPKVTGTSSGLELEFKGTLDTAGTTYGKLISDPFTLSDYDGVANIEDSFLLSNAGNVKVKIALLKSDYFTVPASMDSTTVLQDSLKTKVETFGYVALQGIREKYYTVTVRNLPKGRKTTTFDFKIKSPARDYR
jgi:hypothetical protein